MGTPLIFPFTSWTQTSRVWSPTVASQAWVADGTPEALPFVSTKKRTQGSDASTPTVLSVPSRLYTSPLCTLPSGPSSTSLDCNRPPTDRVSTYGASVPERPSRSRTQAITSSAPATSSSLWIRVSTEL